MPTLPRSAVREAAVDGLEVLSHEECWALLASHTVGRFVANRPGGCPVVTPVNYRANTADRSIVFRSSAGAKLNALSVGLVGMQIDEIDPLHHTGWSVLVQGHGQWLYEEQDADAIEPWAPGERPYVVRLGGTRISGRRIRLAQIDTDVRGYR